MVPFKRKNTKMHKRNLIYQYQIASSIDQQGLQKNFLKLEKKTMYN